LSQAETLEDFRSILEDTDYGSFLQDEASPFPVSLLVAKAKQKLATEFSLLEGQSVKPLSTFLQYVRREKMIDNVVTLIQGAIAKKSAKELLAKCDPLGSFESMQVIPLLDVSQGYDDIYRTILIDTEVGPYFAAFLEKQAALESDPLKAAQDVSKALTNADLDLLRAYLRKAWLEDFYQFCQSDQVPSGPTQAVMSHLLKSEADAQVLRVTLNAFQSSNQLSLKERAALYPNFGYLWPSGSEKMKLAEDPDTIADALMFSPAYRKMFDSVKHVYFSEDMGDAKEPLLRGQLDEDTLEDLLYQASVSNCEGAFAEQFHFGLCFAFVKLREQEIRNLEWMANMIVMGRRDKMERILFPFASHHK
jgi:V-type H+-transporting ATPase subunit d